MNGVVGTTGSSTPIIPSAKNPQASRKYAQRTADDRCNCSSGLGSSVTPERYQSPSAKEASSTAANIVDLASLSMRCRTAVLMVIGLTACSSSPKPSNDGAIVVSTTPSNDAAGIEPAVAIALVFDKAIDPQTLSAAITLTPERSFTVSWDAASLTATVTPTVVLATEVTYQLDVATSVTTPDGAPLRQAHTLSFAVRPATTCAATDTTTISRGSETASVELTGTELRSYTMRTTASLRDGLPVGGEISVSELQGQMLLRSGHDMFDALFAMAIEEVRQNSVSEIRDGAFGGGAPTACECFETGEKWTYVWTRDTAYAAHLGLALVDPSRTRRSLEFKLSERKASVGGGDRQIVQDTGSGGSYPVSTDRVVWAHGAREVLAFLAGDERTNFRDLAYDAAVNTIELDRTMVFDPRDGLYRGEQSFLDWREQSYPSWMAQDMSHIAMSKTLSTNIGHLALLRLARDLANEKSDATAEQRYAGFATALADAIRTTLLSVPAAPHSMIATELSVPLTAHRDLLGESLAILGDVLDGGDAVASYPRSPTGSPVIWPQLPDIPIYHNRGSWPFVSAYSLLAARKVRNPYVFNFEVGSLATGAALNLSNMENFDFANGNNYTDAGGLSGPVVNSRRQLWSVAGYVAMVTKGLFGVEAGSEGIRFRPAMTGRIRHDWFGSQRRIHLRNVPFKGHSIDVDVILPDCVDDNQWLETDAVWLDGVDIGDRFIRADELGSTATLTITLSAAPDATSGMTQLTDLTDPTTFIAPREPQISQVAVSADHLAVTIDARGETGVSFDVLRDGEWIAEDTTSTVVQDAEATDYATRTRCYAVRAKRGGLVSHYSAPVCFWGESVERVSEIDATSFTATGGTFSTANGRPHYQDWGDPGHSLEVDSFQPSQTGDYYLQTVYANGAGPVNTGITAATKWVQVRDTADDSIVGEGMIVMPQRNDWATWTASSLLPVSLDSTKTYRLIISDATNMSYFDHFTRYVNPGGGDQPFNRVNITAIRFLAM